jgi:hypothetical protein
MRAVGMVLRARLRQHWKPWLALAMLAALVGGLVMAAAATAKTTAAAFPGFVARQRACLRLMSIVLVCGIIRNIVDFDVGAFRVFGSQIVQ